MEYLKKLIQQISSRRFMFTILNILGLSIIIYILYATQAVWMSWVRMVLKIIEPFFVGFTIAYVFSPFVSYLEKHRIKRNYAIGITIILILLFLVAMIGTLLPLLYKNIMELTTTFTNGIQELEKILMNSFNIDISSYSGYLIDKINEVIRPDSILNTSLSMVGQALTILGNVIIYIVLSIYFLADYSNVRKRIKKVSHFISPKLPIYLKKIDVGLIDYIKAFLILSCIQGVLYGGMYLILGHPNWFTLGLLSGVSGIFPYIGPILANTFGFITTLGLGTTKVLLLLLMIFILSNLDAYYITPKIYSKKIEIKSIWVLFGILTGSTLFGPIGVVIAMPLLVIFKISIQTYREQNSYQEENYYD